MNALYNKTQFWDGRVNTLEQQAALPITNPFEMGSVSIGDAVSRIAGDTDYQTQFMQAFGRGVNEQDMLRAIATYERTLVSFDSPFDHFIAGDVNAIGDSAKRGWVASMFHNIRSPKFDINISRAGLDAPPRQVEATLGYVSVRD